MTTYCDECQLPLEECSNNCPARIERDIREREDHEWEIMMRQAGLMPLLP